MMARRSKQFEKNEDEDSIWVQCENPLCMKWRKMSKDFCDDFKNISWFCHMNPNPKYNNCDEGQERMYIPRGQTIIFSELPVGSLVWAKMSGYPRWPGIISPDPCYEDETHLIRYDDGTNDPKHYHIEFLGEPHSHAWVSARFVQLYNTSTVDLGFTEKSMKKKALKLNFQKSVGEAAQLCNLTDDKRRKKCVYKYVKPTDEEKTASHLKIQDQSVIDDLKKGHKATMKTGDVDKNNLFININGNMYPLHLPTIQQQTICNIMSDTTTTKQVSIPKSKTSTKLYGIVKPIMKLNKEQNEKEANSENKDVRKKMRRKRARSSNTQKEKAVFLDELNLTKKSFESDVSNMCLQECPIISENKKALKDNNAEIEDEDTFMKFYNNFRAAKNIHNDINHITWYNKTISLFNLYKKVQCMGGYKQATSHCQIWQGICQDVLKTNLDSQFISLRRAYRQMLLPFEQYMRLENRTAKTCMLTQNFPDNVENKPVATDSPPLITNSVQYNANTQLNSPVYLPTIPTKKISSFVSPMQVVPVLTNTIESGFVTQTDSALKDVVPPVTVRIFAGIGDLPSSNPQSPYGIVPGFPSIADIGLDVAMGELDELEKQILNMASCSQNNSEDSESLSLIDDADCYAPIHECDKDEEFTDVLGELTDLEGSRDE